MTTEPLTRLSLELPNDGAVRRFWKEVPVARHDPASGTRLLDASVKSGRRPSHENSPMPRAAATLGLSPVVCGPPSLRLAGPRRPGQFICRDPFGEWVESILEDKNG